MRAARLSGYSGTHVDALCHVSHQGALFGGVDAKEAQVGGRFRFVSGNPFTPVTGATYDASEGGYIPISGAYNSARVPAFHQLDLRVDKRFVWKRVVLTTYLDILNVYNHRSAEFVNYSYDYSQYNNIPTLPIIPSLGIRLEV